MRACVRKRASRAGKVGPDLNFGPDVVSSEPISKVASGNHGGNGHAVPPLVLSPPLNRSNHNDGGYYCARILRNFVFEGTGF